VDFNREKLGSMLGRIRHRIREAAQAPTLMSSGIILGFLTGFMN
jgi:hypothetical protein